MKHLLKLIAHDCRGRFIKVVDGKKKLTQTAKSIIIILGAGAIGAAVMLGVIGTEPTGQKPEELAAELIAMMSAVCIGLGTFFYDESGDEENDGACRARCGTAAAWLLPAGVIGAVLVCLML